MVALYVKRILEGKMTLEQVPARWHEAVAEALDAEGEDGDSPAA